MLIKCIPTGKDIDKALAEIDAMPTGPSREQIIVPWMLKANCPVLNDDPQWFDDPGAKQKLVTIKKLAASQEYLRRDNLIWHVKHPGWSQEGKHIHAQVVKINGVRVICDGHHRLAALMLLGIDEELVWQLKV